MNTYLLYFGKSSDFRFSAYLNGNLVPEFGKYFGDFNYLESNILMPGGPGNETMFGKYTLSLAGRNYTLLKALRFAQATNSTRILGSSIGVAILSDGDIQLSSSNLSALESQLNAFESVALIGRKFKQIDFQSVLHDVDSLSIIQKFSISPTISLASSPGPSKAAIFILENPQQSAEISSLAGKFPRAYFAFSDAILTANQIDSTRSNLSVFKKRNGQFIDEVQFQKQESERRQMEAAKKAEEERRQEELKRIERQKREEQQRKEEQQKKEEQRRKEELFRQQEMQRNEERRSKERNQQTHSSQQQQRTSQPTGRQQVTHHTDPVIEDLKQIIRRERRQFNNFKKISYSVILALAVTALYLLITQEPDSNPVPPKNTDSNNPGSKTTEQSMSSLDPMQAFDFKLIEWAFMNPDSVRIRQIKKLLERPPKTNTANPNTTAIKTLVTKQLAVADSMCRKLTTDSVQFQRYHDHLEQQLKQKYKY